MPDPSPNPRRRQFQPGTWRVLTEAKSDAGYPFLSAHDDLQMLVAFLERFDRLGWIPPVDDNKRQLLADYGVIIHVVGAASCLYEFCSKGARGERDPWITLFFHVNATDGQVRICGVERTEFVERRRTAVIQRMLNRAAKLERALDRQTREMR